MRPRLLLTCALAMLLVPLSPTRPAGAAGFIVNSPVDALDANPGDGVCATTAGLCTLRAAVQESNAAPASGTIAVPPGTYVLSIVGRGEDLAATGDLDITRPLTIAGAGPGSTIIDGNTTDRIFHVIGSITVQLSGLTLRSGAALRPAAISADGGGGAIYVAGGGSLTLSNTVVTGNNAGSGAIAIDDSGSLAVSRSTIIGNTASFGAGIFNRNGSVTIASTTMSGNTASLSGGGIYHRLGSLSVVDSTITGNAASSASIGGGGILVELPGASATITGSVLSTNTANNGAGIHTRGSVSLTNSTVSGNIARGAGGGVYVGGGSTTLSNTTLSSNSADVQGAAVSTAGGAALVRNTVLANSTAGGNCAGPITSLGYNLDTGRTCALTGPGDLVGIGLQLGPLQNNGGATMTHALLPPNPAIDAGHPAPPGSGGACESTDQRGQRRPNDGNGDGTARCDIGAFEAPTVSVSGALIPGFVSAPTALPASVPVTPSPTVSPTATPSSATTPNRAFAPPTPVRVAPLPVPPKETATSEPTWVLVTEPTEAMSVTGDPIEAALPDEWYVVLAEEDGWLLVASHPDWPFWLPDDERVEVHRSA